MTGLLVSCMMMAEMSPIYLETFNRCFDDEDENYGYTGGNDGQWGGDVLKLLLFIRTRLSGLLSTATPGINV